MISILIPTRDRPQHLKRLLSYYNDSRFSYRIVVADASSHENKQANRRTISSLPTLDIQYRGDYPHEIDPQRKFVDALEWVSTKYCVICADDDFITPNGLVKSADFLEANSDFTAAHGDYAHFRVATGSDGERQFYWGLDRPREYISSPRARERLSHHLSTYGTTFYAVHRTDFLRMILDETLKSTDDYRLRELLSSALTVIHGMVKNLDVFYAARESSAVSTARTCKPLAQQVREGGYDRIYAAFRDCLSAHLVEVGGLTADESRSCLDEALSSYMIRCGLRNYARVPARRRRDILANLPLLTSIRCQAGALYRRSLAPILYPAKQSDGVHSSAELNRSSKYYTELGRICDVVLASC